MAVHDDAARFREPVAAYDDASSTPCGPSELDALLPIFERDQVAIVADDKQFYGLITRIDLLNHLRKKLT